MATNHTDVVDVFEIRFCGLCGSEDLSQYYRINENYIKYKELYLSLREILNNSLDTKIDRETGRLMDICLDCKDKAIKFYHFKQRVKAIQSIQQQNLRRQQESHKTSQNSSKVVHNIFRIIESYTEKFSVAAIRVEENSKKLIIEAQDEILAETSVTVKEEDESEADLLEEASAFHEQFQANEGSIFSEDLSMTSNSGGSVIMIKEEPDDDDDDLSEIIFQSRSESGFPPPSYPLSQLSSSSPSARPSFPVARKKTSLPIRPLPSASTEVSHSYGSATSARTFRQRNGRRRSDGPVSAAAIKMRMYREKLKKPENRDKFLQHKQKQKEWNRQYYQRKMMKDMLSNSDMFLYP